MRTNRPKGDLYGLSESDINIICDMDGNRMPKRTRIVCAVFMRMRILRKDNEGYTLHDWADHQPFAF